MGAFLLGHGVQATFANSVPSLQAVSTTYNVVILYLNTRERWLSAY